MTIAEAQTSGTETAEQHAAHVAEQTVEADAYFASQAESVLYGDFRPIATAPRDRSWIEIRFRNPECPDYQPASHYARSAGNGDMPDIWRFSDGGALRYAQEARWQWRPIDDEIVVTQLIAGDRVKQG